MVSKTEHSSVCRGELIITFMVIFWKSCAFSCRQDTYQVNLISKFFKHALGPHSGIIHTSGSLRNLPAYCVTRDIFQHMLIKWIFLALCKNSRCPCRDGTWCRRLSQPFLETPWYWLQQLWACQQPELHWTWAVCHERVMECDRAFWELTQHWAHITTFFNISAYQAAYIAG